jgi:pentatricopeptide repeat protein
VPDYEGLIGHAVESRNAVAAERFLRRMVSDYHAGSSPQVPNGRVYNQVLHSYAMVGNARHARDILKLMWNDYHRGNGQALPNQRCYTSCMYAWQKSSNKFEAPEQTEHLLREMYDLYASDKAPMCKPDVFCYTCVLHCWADSHRDDAVERATSLFRLMMERYEEGEKDLKPDNVVYSNLINVYIRAANDRNKAALLDRVEGIFWEMVEAHLQGNKKAAPSRRNFNTLLAAWSKESGPKYALKAEALIASWQALNKQKKVVETPDSYSYSLMLKAWYVSKVSCS